MKRWIKPIGAKYSSAYCPPEIATALFPELDMTLVNIEARMKEIKSQPDWDDDERLLHELLDLKKARTKKLAKTNNVSTSAQLKGDPTFDIWSFGVVLYELVVGTRLFQRDVNNDNIDKRQEKVRLFHWEDAENILQLTDMFQEAT